MQRTYIQQIVLNSARGPPAVPNDATHVQTSENVVLTQHYVIVTQDATQAQTAENVILSAHYSITTQDATQAQTADNITLTDYPYFILTVQDTEQLQTSDNVDLVQAGAIVAQDATHLQTSDTIALTQHHILAVLDATQLQSSDNVTLTASGPTFTLTVQDAAQAQTGVENYKARIMNPSPVFYLALDETSGSMAINNGTSGSGADSSYTGVTLAQIQAPGGGLAPYFDGTGDYVDTKTDTLNANFNHSIGTMSFWVKMSLPDVWDDSSGANLWANAFINGAHTISFWKVPSYMARAEYYDGVDFTVRYDFNPNTYEWILLASTWTTAGQQFIAYKNGVALGAPLFIDSGPSGDLTTSNIGNQL